MPGVYPTDFLSKPGNLETISMGESYTNETMCIDNAPFDLGGSYLYPNGEFISNGTKGACYKPVDHNPYRCTDSGFLIGFLQGTLCSAYKNGFPQFKRIAYKADATECSLANYGTDVWQPTYVYNFSIQDGVPVPIFRTCDPSTFNGDNLTVDTRRVAFKAAMTTFCNGASYTNTDGSPGLSFIVGTSTCENFNSPQCKLFCTEYPNLCGNTFARCCGTSTNYIANTGCENMSTIPATFLETSATNPIASTLMSMCNSTNIQNEDMITAPCTTNCFATTTLAVSVNCQQGYETFCQRKIAADVALNPTESLMTAAEHVLVTHPYCACFFSAPVYTSYYDSLTSQFPKSEALATYLAQAVTIPHCNYPACSQSAYKPRGAATCPNQINCLQNAQINIVAGNDANVTGGVNSDQTCNSLLDTFNNNLDDGGYNNDNYVVRYMLQTGAGGLDSLNQLIVPIPAPGTVVLGATLTLDAIDPFTGVTSPHPYSDTIDFIVGQQVLLTEVRIPTTALAGEFNKINSYSNKTLDNGRWAQGIIITTADTPPVATVKITATNDNGSADPNTGVNVELMDTAGNLLPVTTTPIAPHDAGYRYMWIMIDDTPSVPAPVPGVNPYSPVDPGSFVPNPKDSSPSVSGIAIVIVLLLILLLAFLYFTKKPKAPLM